MPQDFWAQVRFFSQELGYSSRDNDGLSVFTDDSLVECARQNDVGLSHGRIVQLREYLNYRAQLLNSTAPGYLMSEGEASQVFDKLQRRLNPSCNLPMNKQKGEKSHPNYLTGIVNMLTEEALRGCRFDSDPHSLTLVTKGKTILRTLSRRFDGAYPSTRNPVAVWEIKEYYGTTTFGSRVADAIYETQLDGWELKDLREKEGRKIQHYLIVDDKFTWWNKGKSYLCRLVDMVHMGLLDEVLFGREVLARWPQIVGSWPTEQL